MPRLKSSRRPGWTLYGYLAREALLPFAFALVGLTLAVLTGDLIGFSELVINRGIGAFQVALIALYEAAPVASFIFPFALLVALLVALGRLGADREILVLEASGVSAVRLIPPALAVSAAANLKYCQNALCMPIMKEPTTNSGKSKL